MNDLIVLEFRDHILRYARRFFHHLLRHRRLQKSFLLAIDIGAQDLFLDVHHMALHYKEFGLAAEAARKVDECIESDEYEHSGADSDDNQAEGTIQRFMKHVHGKFKLFRWGLIRNPVINYVKMAMDRSTSLNISWILEDLYTW